MMARQRRKGLSERQKKILEVLDSFQKRTGYPPAIREICVQANISSTSVVNYYLDQLETMGYIERDQGVSRGIRLLQPAHEALNPVAGAVATARDAARTATTAVRQTAENFGQTIGELLQIPVLGRIRAGSDFVLPPTADFSLFDPLSMVDVATSLLPKSERGDGLFALEVEGDSMIDAMVFDGDIVILKPTKEARNGEMVAVLRHDTDETTLKYFYLEKDRVRLQPANPSYEPIYIADPGILDIQGKVVMVIRQVKGRVS